LRRYREHVGYALEDAARVLECDRSKISRIETGQRGIRPKELRELLTEYGVPESDQAALVAIASRGSQRGWWHPYAGSFSEAYLDYVIMESIASEIMAYEAQLVPDLLQTEDYARAIAAAEPGYATGGQREDAVEAMEVRRQGVLTGTPSGSSGSSGRRLWVILGEGALHQAVGGPGVLAGQIRHLVQLSVVYVEALSGGVYLESQADVARYIRAFALLRASALSVADSVRLLRDLGGLA